MTAPDYIFEASSKPSLPWHEEPLIRATDRVVQGAVHARVSADIGAEFGIYPVCPLRADKIRDI